MASMDLSLDDIIKKKKITVKGRPGFKKIGGNAVNSNRGNNQSNSGRRPGGVQQRRTGVQTTGRAVAQNAGRLNAPKLGPGRTAAPNKSVVDARNRIILKKRLKLTDARDKLCELAKKTDVRQKLEKLRELRLGHDGVVGYNGLHIRKPMRSPLGGLGRVGVVPGAITLQRTINQPISSSRYVPKVPAALMDMDLELSDGFMTDRIMPLRRTVNNDQMRIEPLIRPSKLSNPSPYSWRAPQQRSAPPSSSRGYIDLDYPAEERKRMKLPSPPPMMRPIVVSDDDDLGEPVRPTIRSSRAPSSNTMGSSKVRLESSRTQSSSSAASASGFRIVVSNLQNSVTHEDIRELFEDIGPLLSSKLVRPGTAEVVYRQFKDAELAVENYHNRQLDGQPMKCLLVKPRPSTASNPSSGSLRAPVGASSKLSGSGKSSVVPDITTIHKALFNKP